jgi:hypothetical protein
MAIRSSKRPARILALAGFNWAVSLVAGLAHNAMRQFHQVQVKRQPACADEFETNQAVRFNQYMIMLAANMPETRRVLLHQ